jgi:hypothetical protein
LKEKEEEDYEKDKKKGEMGEIGSAKRKGR